MPALLPSEVVAFRLAIAALVSMGLMVGFAPRARAQAESADPIESVEVSAEVGVESDEEIDAEAPATEPAPASGGVHHVEPPPSPDRREPELLAAVHIGAVVPLESSDICPGTSLCVLGAGGAVGFEIERRWPLGIGISVAYDAWFVDSNGVFELGTVQIIRAAVGFAFGDEWAIHPAIHIGGGALVFGDSLLVSTVGGAAEVGLSGELELTETVSVNATVRGWLFSTTPFTTGRDRTMRAGGGLNVALQLSVGIVILAASGGD